MIFDVAVIGAGVTGGMTAYCLSKYNLKIAVIEAKNDAGAGISKANSAIVHAGYDAEEGSLKALLNVHGCEMMEEICEKLAVPYKKCGSHVVAFTDDDMEMLRKLLLRGRANGVKNLEIISGERLKEMEPNVSKKAIGSLWASDVGIVSPYILALRATENAVTNGAEFFKSSPVTAIKQRDGYIEIQAGDRTINARYAVNAAGFGAEDIAEMAGDEKIGIIPRRGEYFLLDKRTPVKVNSTIFCCPSANGKGILVSPTAYGNVIVGPNAERTEDPYDTSTTAKGLSSVGIGAHMLVPQLCLSDMITSFSGMRPTPENGDFNIYFSKKIKGLINAVGIESPGLASSPATGEYIKNMLEKDGLLLALRDNYITTSGKNGNIKPFIEMSEDEKNEAMLRDTAYGHMICRCESISEGDIKAAFESPVPPADMDGIERRTRAGMGRCRGGFCQPLVAQMLADYLEKELDEVTKSGGKSLLLAGKSEKKRKSGER